MAAFDQDGRSRTLVDLPEQAAFHPVSRQLAQLNGVRKGLPFSLCIRPEVIPLYSHLDEDTAGHVIVVIGFSL